MDQIHKRFTAEQVKALLKGYCEGILDRSSVEEILGVSKTRFFALLRQYRHDPDRFALTYQRTTHARLPASVEMEIGRGLMLDRRLIDGPTLTWAHIKAAEASMHTCGIPLRYYVDSW